MALPGTNLVWGILEELPIPWLLGSHLTWQLNQPKYFYLKNFGLHFFIKDALTNYCTGCTTLVQVQVHTVQVPVPVPVPVPVQ